MAMKIGMLYIGMTVKHPNYGMGVVKSLNEHAAEIDFPEGRRTVAPETSDLEPAQAQASVSGLEVPLQQFVDQVARTVVKELGLEKPESFVDKLAARWHRGRLVIHPSDPALQTKEVPLDVFFHKIVMMRNNLRVLEQKINSYPALSEADKIDLQQYITKCYGSMTTFNLLFREKEDYF